MKKIIAFDTETYLIQPGLMAPPLVCLQWGALGDESMGYGVVRATSATHEYDYRIVNTGVMLKGDAVLWFKEQLTGPNVLVGQNVAFDLAVMLAAAPELTPLVFDKLKRGEIRDTMVRQKLIDNAFGKMLDHAGAYSMASIFKREFSIEMGDIKSGEGEGYWRKNYNQLDGIPLHKWPQDALKYAHDDGLHTFTLHEYQAQPKYADKGQVAGPEGVVNEIEQVKAAFSLHLMSVWGMRTEASAVHTLKHKLTQQADDMFNVLIKTNLKDDFPADKTAPDGGPLRTNKGKKYGTGNKKNLQWLINKAYNGYPPLTDPSKTYPDGQISTSGDAIEAVQDFHPALKALAEGSKAKNHLNTFVKALEQGITTPVNPGYDVLKATGRTSSFSPNIQNFPRAGGFRECFVARPGRAFVACDYSTIELRALAQVCLELVGHSAMAEALRAGADLHLELAAQMYHVTYEYAEAAINDKQHPEYKKFKQARQLAKAANFGFPGGMVATTFQEYVKGYGVTLSPQDAVDLHNNWKKKWPEMQDYFNIIKAEVGYGEATIKQLGSGRQRGGAKYCAACNTYFQGMAADGAKEAMFLIAEECYAIPESVLFGSRPVAFIHDELLVEVPLDKVGEAAARIEALMIQGMQKFVKDVPVLAEPVISLTWDGRAEQVYDENGMLMVWEG